MQMRQSNTLTHPTCCSLDHISRVVSLLALEIFELIKQLGLEPELQIIQETWFCLINHLVNKERLLKSRYQVVNNYSAAIVNLMRRLMIRVDPIHLACELDFGTLRQSGPQMLRIPSKKSLVDSWNVQLNKTKALLLCLRHETHWICKVAKSLCLSETQCSSQGQLMRLRTKALQ